MYVQKVVVNVKDYGRLKTVSVPFILSHKRMIITDDVMSHRLWRAPDYKRTEDRIGIMLQSKI